MIDLIVFAFGIYIIYSCVDMKVRGNIRGGMMLPKGIEPKHCKDPAGYISFIFPKMAAVGVVSLVCGILGLLMDYLQIVPEIVYYASMVVFLVILIWYSVVSRKGINKYWNIK